MTTPNTDWMNDAACRGYPIELWFPKLGGDNGHKAKQICSTCPVRDRCSTYAATGTVGAEVGIKKGPTPARYPLVGIWAGEALDSRQRRTRQRLGERNRTMDNATYDG